MAAKEHLIEWTIGFLKNRDLLQRKIEEIQRDKEGYDIYVRYKDKEQFILVEVAAEDALLSKFDENKHFGLVLLNTMSNFQFLLKNWQKIVKFRNLCVYFVNPFSKLDKKWIVYPYTHHSICEESSLEKGLHSMFEMVDILSESDVRDKFK